MAVLAQRPFVIVVDGIIGAGKTTFIEECLVPHFRSLGLQVEVVPEGVKKWESTGRLQQFYEDPSRRGYQFQTMAFHDRIVRAREIYEATKETADIYVLDRSIFTDVLFMNMLRDSKTVDSTEYEDYMNLWTMWVDLMPFVPNLFVYLKPQVKECMERLKNRNRDGEAGVSLDYQKQLEAKHDDFLGGPFARLRSGRRKWRIPVLRLETNDNFRDDEAVKSEMSRQVFLEIQSLAMESPSHPSE